jgi:hypothetical protein
MKLNTIQMKTANASDYFEVAPLILQALRAKRDVCSAELKLAFYRLEETRARLKLHSVKLKNAGQRLDAAQLEIGRVRASMRKGCPTSLIGCPGQSTTCGRSVPIKGGCELFSPCSMPICYRSCRPSLRGDSRRSSHCQSGLTSSPSFLFAY